MQRIVLGPGVEAGVLLAVPDETAHYLRDVMRLGAGARIWVSDGQGWEGSAVIESATRELVQVLVESWGASSREPKVQITVGQGLPKGDKMEWVIQKCTELGATAFWPVACARSISVIEPKKEAKKMERWGKIALEASEQSHRAVVPVVEAPLGVKAATTKFASYDLVLVAAEGLGHQGDVADSGLRSVLQRWRSERDTRSVSESLSILVLVGPEGGWTDQEVALMTEAGAVAVSLGKRILRTETAALVALSAIYYEFGEYGG